MNCDEAAPSLTRLYVTNAFMRAVMNDEGTGIDEEKFTRYLEGVVEGLEESMRGLGKSIEGGVRRLEKRLEEWHGTWRIGTTECTTCSHHHKKKLRNHSARLMTYLYLRARN